MHNEPRNGCYEAVCIPLTVSFGSLYVWDQDFIVKVAVRNSVKSIHCCGARIQFAKGKLGMGGAPDCAIIFQQDSISPFYLTAQHEHNKGGGRGFSFICTFADPSLLTSKDMNFYDLAARTKPIQKILWNIWLC